MHLSTLREENLQLRHQVNVLQQQLNVLREYHDRNEAKKANARQVLRQQEQQRQQQPFSSPTFFQETSQGMPHPSESRTNHVSECKCVYPVCSMDFFHLLFICCDRKCELFGTTVYLAYDFVVCFTLFCT